jgi:hypothetical protein
MKEIGDMKRIDTTNRSRWVTMLFALAAISGCDTTSSPSATEADYGNSVRAMVSNQTLDPAPADSAPVDSGDGVHAQNTLDVYRKDVSQPQQVNQDLIIGTNGNNNSGR